MSKKLLGLVGAAGIFIAGMFAGAVIGPLNTDNNIPTGFTIKEKAEEVANTLNPFTGSASIERASPGNWIGEDQIFVQTDKIVLDVKNAQWAMFTNTNSMDPVLDENSNALQIVPESEADIQVGDIISYEHAEYGRIIHRVVYKGYDENGIYFIMKGDNNQKSDPDKVRFDQIKTVTIAIIY